MKFSPSYWRLFFLHLLAAFLAGPLLAQDYSNIPRNAVLPAEHVEKNSSSQYPSTSHYITVRQYAAFLNGEAARDLGGLYDQHMITKNSKNSIIRSGGVGNYTYSFSAEDAEQAIVSLNILSACRFYRWNGEGDEVYGYAQADLMFSSVGNIDPLIRTNYIPFPLAERALPWSKDISENYFSKERMIEVASVLGLLAGVGGGYYWYSREPARASVQERVVSSLRLHNDWNDDGSATSDSGSSRSRGSSADSGDFETPPASRPTSPSVRNVPGSNFGALECAPDRSEEKFDDADQPELSDSPPLSNSLTKLEQVRLLQAALNTAPFLPPDGEVFLERAHKSNDLCNVEGESPGAVGTPDTSILRLSVPVEESSSSKNKPGIKLSLEQPEQEAELSHQALLQRSASTPPSPRVESGKSIQSAYRAIDLWEGFLEEEKKELKEELSLNKTIARKVPNQNSDLLPQWMSYQLMALPVFDAAAIFWHHCTTGAPIVGFPITSHVKERTHNTVRSEVEIKLNTSLCSSVNVHLESKVEPLTNNGFLFSWNMNPPEQPKSALEAYQSTFLFLPHEGSSNQTLLRYYSGMQLKNFWAKRAASLMDFESSAKGLLFSLTQAMTMEGMPKVSFSKDEEDEDDGDLPLETKKANLQKDLSSAEASR